MIFKLGKILKLHMIVLITLSSCIQNVKLSRKKKKSCIAGLYSGKTLINSKVNEIIQKKIKNRKNELIDT